MDEELQHTSFEGIADYVEALDALCGLAKRSLYMFDKSFEDAGFNSVERYETLRAFLLENSANELHLLVHDPRPITQYCPRLIMLQQQFSHNMRIHRTPPHFQYVSDPFSVADDLHFVRRFHFDDSRGIFARNDPQGARVLKSRFEEMWAVSRQAVTAATLGL
jgi:hypothetical protein